jgi:hypothetical protein
MLCGVAIFAGVAAFGYVYNDPLADYISDHVFNDGKTSMMEAEARDTYKRMPGQVDKHNAVAASTVVRTAGATVVTK